ncbi:MAG: hypothetical protein DHS20C21_08750 [Gemmatimonadota bacterium]|nr:MAG: hypothetical protein DHS20C21_08750 [Gemmatimonadota bacterium]
MKLRRSRAASRLRWTLSFGLFWAAILAGCERDDTVNIDTNRPPETFVTEGPLPSLDPLRPTLAFYRTHVYWRGEDTDGTVVGFRFAIDDTSDPSAWQFTTKTDSIFRFQTGEVNAKEHLFLIRAVDNLGKQDATPDTLRFESFTAAIPVVQYVPQKFQVTHPTIAFTGLSAGDTVLVNSDVTLVWTGSDADGEVARWESTFRGVTVQHDRADTMRTIRNLPSGLQQFEVTAFDDAGAASSGGLFQFFSNFDPRTTINSVTSRTLRPWLPPGNTLVRTHDLTDAVPDTIPYGAHLQWCWSSTDRDGPVVGYFWKFGFFSGATDTTGPLCVDLASEDGQDRPIQSTFLNVPANLEVRGRDIHGKVEGRPEVVRLFVNFPPKVTINPSPPIVVNTAARFTFSLSDVDSDPSQLRYRFQIDDELPSPVTVITGPLVIDAFFQEVGTHRLKIWAQDQGGVQSQSEPAELIINVIPAEPASHPSGSAPGPNDSAQTGAGQVGTQ